jgi:hypothetical protein
MLSVFMAYRSFGRLLAGFDTRLDTPPSSDRHHPGSAIAPYAQGRGEGVYGKSRGFPDALQARGFRPIKDTMGLRGRGMAGVRLHYAVDDLDES